MNSYSPVGVVYLAREAEGLEPVRRFVDSYVVHDAGEAHDLIIVLKGYDKPGADLEGLRCVLNRVQYRFLHIDDSGVDITAYQYAASKLEYETMCFLNTHTKIADVGWLKKLSTNIRHKNVGLVGATGSYESVQSSLQLLSKAVWLCEIKKVPYDENLAKHFNFWLRHHAPAWLAHRKMNLMLEWLKTLFSPKISFDHYWRKLTAANAMLNWAPGFPLFPNPHIRTNGFMIKRERLLGFPIPAVRDKIEAMHFESGVNSLTAHLRGLGLSALVVGKDGIGYAVEDWPASRTFRLGQQENLLITDNHVRNFWEYSPEERALHVFMTWGDYVMPQSLSFPSLDMRFCRAPRML